MAKEVALLISTINQPVNVIYHLDHVVSNSFYQYLKHYQIKTVQIQWLAMLKLWLQEPKLDGLLTDDVIMKQGEHIVDCERTLATMIQSSNVRLPGQRSCQYISLEALKDVQKLKTVLSARIHDFLHAIFLIPPESLSLFEWCSADYFLVST